MQAHSQSLGAASPALSEDNPIDHLRAHSRGKAKISSPIHSSPTTSGSGSSLRRSSKHRTSKIDTHTQHRLQKACDACSLRKVKCDHGHPCSPCKGLDIPCTFDRPTRRRGPPNRLAETLKRNDRLDQKSKDFPVFRPTVDQNSGYSSTSLTAESIAPFELVMQLVDDYFTYLHPIQPFPHEPSFRQSLLERRDVYDRYFLALLASMIGALVASYPRRPRRRLKVAGQETMFEHAIDFLSHCHKVATEARGGGYIERDGIDMNDAITSYCLMVMCGCSYRWTQGNLYFGEMTTIIRCLIVPGSIKDESLVGDTTKKRGTIEEEMMRRLSWAMFVVARSSLAFGSALGDVNITPATPLRQYPPMPREVDDEYIRIDHIDPQPSDIPSYMAAFNANVWIYRTHDPLVAVENSLGMDWAPSIEMRRDILRGCLQSLETCMQHIPEHISITYESEAGVSSHRHDVRGLSPCHSPVHHSTPKQESCAKRREIAYEFQKANTQVSYLSTRSLFVEKYYNLVDSEHARLERHAQASNEEKKTYADTVWWVRTEREKIASDLLRLLSSIYPIHVEPNGASLTMKIRQIASTLLPGFDATSEPDIAERRVLGKENPSTYYLKKFLDILIQLEQGSRPETGSRPSPMDEDGGEDADLRVWSNFKKFQLQWAQNDSVAVRRA